MKKRIACIVLVLLTLCTGCASPRENPEDTSGTVLPEGSEGASPVLRNWQEVFRRSIDGFDDNCY